MALTPRAAHVLQCPVQCEPIPRGGGNLKNWAQFGLWAATRPHEAGIASNRESARHGEYVPEPCTHRPSSQGSRKCPKFVLAATYGKFDNKD